MAKLLLMSVIFATVLIAVWASADQQPRRGLAKAIRALLIYCFIYLMLVMYVYPEICW
jgi:hypothetical protein